MVARKLVRTGVMWHEVKGLGSGGGSGSEEEGRDMRYEKGNKDGSFGGFLARRDGEKGPKRTRELLSWAPLAEVGERKGHLTGKGTLDLTPQ